MYLKLKVQVHGAHSELISLRVGKADRKVEGIHSFGSCWLWMQQRKTETGSAQNPPLFSDLFIFSGFNQSRGPKPQKRSGFALFLQRHGADWLCFYRACVWVNVEVR